MLNQDYFNNRSNSLSDANPISHTTMTTMGNNEAERRIKGSFPAKFETLIIKKESRNAFGSSVERFLDMNITQTSNNSQIILK